MSGKPLQFPINSSPTEAKRLLSPNLEESFPSSSPPNSDDDSPKKVPGNNARLLKTLLIPVLVLFVVSAIVVFGVIVVMIVYFVSNRGGFHPDLVLCNPRMNMCEYQLVETIPTNLSLQHGDLSIPTHEAILRLLAKAKESVHCLELYFNLNNSAVDLARGQYGKEILEAFIRAKKRGVDVSIVYNAPRESMTDRDIEKMKMYGIKARMINFTKLFGAGILHTKLTVIDKKHLYVGSANMAWSSMSQVKECGILIEGCPCIARDAEKIFQVVDQFLDTGAVNQNLDADGYASRPLNVSVTSESTGISTNGFAYLSATPKMLITEHRTQDIQAYLRLINEAKEYIYGSVMDFLPFMAYSSPHSLWGELQDALENAVLERGVEVRLMVSHWEHTHPSQRPFLRMLQDFETVCRGTKFCKGGLTVREFVVPDDPRIPYYAWTRVNHAKFILSETTALISTSNWSKDYFYTTGGASFISTHQQIRQNLEDVFLRDWNSEYVGPVPKEDS